MSVVAVTGGAGRLGRSVVRALAEAGHEVVSIDRTTADALPARQLELNEVIHPRGPRAEERVVLTCGRIQQAQLRARTPNV